MVDECDELPVRRYPGVADPAVRSIQDLPDRKFELSVSADFANDRQASAVGGPVGPQDVFEDLSRRAATGDPKLRQGPASHEGTGNVPIERDGHLSRS